MKLKEFKKQLMKDREFAKISRKADKFQRALIKILASKKDNVYKELKIMDAYFDNL